MRAIFLAGVLCASIASGLQAQKDSPRRPSLPSGADSCDAQAYFTFGLNQLEGDPVKAADAFYWAARLDPTWADPLYARRVALLMADPGRMGQYLEGNRRVIESPRVQQIDSLLYRALTMNPFLYRGLERRMLLKYYRDDYERAARLNGQQPNFALFDYYLEAELRSTSWARAYSAYGTGQFETALEAYASAMKSARDKSWLHAQRGRVFFLLGGMDSAQAELQAAVATLREKDTKRTVYVYESKALYEHSVGLLQENRGDLAAARETYGRALQEDMSYYPAHIRTAALAMKTRDSTAALSSIQLAASIRPDDPAVLVVQGELLLTLKRAADAEAPLRHAVELNDDFAAAHFDLAQALEAQGKRAPAVAEYRAFLEHSTRFNSRRADAETRVRVLSGPTTGGAQ